MALFCVDSWFLHYSLLDYCHNFVIKLAWAFLALGRRYFVICVLPICVIFLLLQMLSFSWNACDFHLELFWSLGICYSASRLFSACGLGWFLVWRQNNLVIRHMDTGVRLPVLLNPGAVIGYETMTNYSTSLYLSFLIYKRDLIIVSTSFSCCGFLWVQMLSRLTRLSYLIIE